jgi:hypothetical protein
MPEPARVGITHSRIRAQHWLGLLRERVRYRAAELFTPSCRVNNCWRA